MDQPIECFASLPYLRLPRFIIKRLILSSGKDESLYRVFAYLVYFARFGQDQPDPEAEGVASRTGELLATREQIADATGLSRSAVSRSVAELVKKGWVETAFVGKVSYFLVCNYAELTGGGDRQKKGARSRAAKAEVVPVVHEREARRFDDE
ncbi:MAG: MarR family transcriptional regulator [Bacteroidota bacterium]|nr:MarR family transcriptional regulator [Bacteroidota bacterium]